MSAIDGGPAFPVASMTFYQPSTVDEGIRAAAGMSLRAYFTAHAPPVPIHFPRESVTFIGPLESGLTGPRKRSETDLEHTVRWRLEYADAMLKAMKL